MNQVARYQLPLTVKTFRKSNEADRAADPSVTEWTKVHAGYLSGDIVVEVDLKALAHQLGERALRSSGKKSVEAGGLVVVKALNVKREAVR